MIWIGARCPSTWSAPSWLSSSTTKIAESFQYGLWEIVSTILPTARSPSATCASGSAVPPVWSLDNHIMLRLAGAFFSNSCFQIWLWEVSGVSVSLGGVDVGDVGGEGGRRRVGDGVQRRDHRAVVALQVRRGQLGRVTAAVDAL